MARKRMFAKCIVLSDVFLSLPASVKSLYYTLNMYADDDGIIGNPDTVIKISRSRKKDLDILLKKRYVLKFESGVVVIKHWRIHNTLRKDRHTSTTYTTELEQLSIDGRNAYTETERHKNENLPNALRDRWLPSGCQMVATDKNSIDKINKNNKKGSIYSDNASYDLEEYIEKDIFEEQK